MKAPAVLARHSAAFVSTCQLHRTLAELAGRTRRPPLHELAAVLFGVDDIFGFLLGDDVQAHEVG
jgi:hypothetical protein